MIAYGYHVDSNYNPERFQTAVTNSIAGGSTYGVLYWRYASTVYILHPEHLRDSAEDTDYYYELYGVTGMNGDQQETTMAIGSYPWYICIRYDKNTPNTSTSIYAHAMTVNDFYGVFGGDLTNSSIYSWHGTDECPSYYLYSYLPLGSEWGIVDGNIPFLGNCADVPALDDGANLIWKADDTNLPWLDAFCDIPLLDDYYELIWKITDQDDCPWKSIFDIRPIDELPNYVWRITEEDSSPWKIPFNPIYEINDFPDILWIIRGDRDDCPWKKAFPKLYRPIKEIPPKYITPKKPITVKSPEYVIDVHNPIIYNIKVKKGVR